MASSLSDACRPAGDIELTGLIVAQMAHFGVRDLPARQQAAVVAPYLDTLRAMPMSIMVAAFRAWHECKLYPNDPGRHAFMPRAPELFALANPRLQKLRQAAYRAKAALEYRAPLPKPRPTAEDRAKVAEMLADFRCSKPMPSDGLRPTGHNHQVAERLRQEAERRA